MTDGKVYSGVLENRVVTYSRVDGDRVPVYQNQQFRVTVNGQPLDPHFEVISYSAGASEPFEWGNLGGRGEYQLAVAILTDAYGPSVAMRCVTQFAREVVRKLREDWSLTDGEVFAYVLGIEMETRDAPVYAEPAPVLPPSGATLAGCGTPPALPSRKRRTRKKKVPSAQPPAASTQLSISA